MDAAFSVENILFLTRNLWGGDNKPISEVRQDGKELSGRAHSAILQGKYDETD